jgi:hypothetical protein
MWINMDKVTGKIKDVGDESEKSAPKLRDLSSEFEDAAKNALKLAADAVTARRKLEDLYTSIDESRLTSSEVGQEQRSLGDEYNELMQKKAAGMSAEESAYNAAVAAGFRGSYAGTKKPTQTMADIDKRLAEIRIQMNRNNQQLVNAGVTRDRANEDITLAGTTTYDPAKAAALLQTGWTALQLTGMVPTANGKMINVTIYQNNTGVISETQVNNAAGKVVATGSALP